MRTPRRQTSASRAAPRQPVFRRDQRIVVDRIDPAVVRNREDAAGYVVLGAERGARRAVELVERGPRYVIELDDFTIKPHRFARGHDERRWLADPRVEAAYGRDGLV